MFREMDARAHEREQAEPDRGGRGGMTPSGIDGPETARDALTHDLDLPRGRSRERVQAHGREYRLSGSEVRTLAAAGAFRVVPAGELTPSDTRTPTRPSREIERLESAGLMKTTPYVVGRTRTRLVMLTLLNNLFGKSKEPFWQQAYTDLLKFVILLRRITDGYTTFSEVYR